MVDVPLDDMLPVPLSNIKEEDVKIDVTSVPTELPIRVFSVSIFYVVRFRFDCVVSYQRFF